MPALAGIGFEIKNELLYSDLNKVKFIYNLNSLTTTSILELYDLLFTARAIS